MNIRVIFEKTVVGILPYKLSRLVGFIFGMLVKRTSYSQYGEDLICWEFFKKWKIEKGTYLDIGAFHPKFISNTHLFYKKGWTGFVVDIDDIKLQSFKLVRGKSVRTFFNAVVPNDELFNTTQIDCYNFKRIWSEIDTLSEEVAIETQKKTGFDYYKTTVPTISIHKLLEAVGKVNLLNIDVEGLDSIIIQNFDFDNFGPDLIIFEDNDYWGGSYETLDLLVKKGYAHLFTSDGSVGYFRKSIVQV
jgi:hypothetical protein